MSVCSTNTYNLIVLKCIKTYWQSPQDVEAIQKQNGLYPYNSTHSFIESAFQIQPGTPKKIKPKQTGSRTPRKGRQLTEIVSTLKAMLKLFFHKNYIGTVM